MDKITKSLLNEFSERHSLEELSEDKVFEHFSAYSIARKHFSGSFNTSDIVTGGGNDLGLDAIAIIINGKLISDIDMIDEIAEYNGYIEATFIFVQADRGNKFKTAKVGDIFSGVSICFDIENNDSANHEVKEEIDKISLIYDRYSSKFRQTPDCFIYYVTTGKWAKDSNLIAKKNNCLEHLKQSQLFRKLEFHYVDAEQLQDAYRQTCHAITRNFLFDNRNDVPETEGIEKAFLGYVSLSEFRKIVSNESGSDVVSSIFYDNVRDWQSWNEVNSQMKDSLNSNDSQRFLLMNNGVTIIASSIIQANNRFTIEDFQVVNGCQTTHVLFNYDGLNSDNIHVPLKLIETKDDQVIESIIRATNNQTRINPAQFSALRKYSKTLEAFFSSYDEGKILYYERREGQYLKEKVPNVSIISQDDLIRSYSSFFRAEPHIAGKNLSTLREQIGKSIFLDEHQPDIYYVSAYALYKLEYFFRSNKIDKSYKPARYHILLLVRCVFNPVVPRINSNEMKKYCDDLSKKLWDIEESEKLFLEAADLINQLSAGNLSRDNIRTQQTTNKILKHFGLTGR